MDQLRSLDFPEEQCAHFLASCGGDVAQAVEAILANPDWQPSPAPAPAPAPSPTPAVVLLRSPAPVSEAVPPQRDLAEPEYGERGSFPWTRGSFVGEFCDCFIDNTDLEGGQSAPALRDLSGYLEAAARDQRQTPLLREHRAAVEFVQAQLRSAADLDESTEASRESASRFHDRLARLAVGEVVTFCGGWLKPPQGHAIMYCIERTADDTFAWVIINTGEGINYHPTSWEYDRDESAAGPRARFRSAVRIEEIPKDKLLDEVVLYVLLRLRAHMNKLHTPAVVYEALVPYLTGDQTFLEAFAAGERRHSDLQGDLETPQRAGTCYYRCVLSCMKYLLKRKGVPKAAIKQLTYVVRQKYLEGIERHLDVPVLDESHHRLIQIACQQTALASWKERRAGRLDQQAMSLVKQLLERIQLKVAAIPSYPPPSFPAPLRAHECGRLHHHQRGAVMRQPFLPIPGCRLLHNGDDSAFRGEPLPPREVRPIDFLAGRGCRQSMRAKIATLEQAMAAIDEELEVIDQICSQERQGQVLPAKLVFFISAVITDLVVNVLPIPLPFAKDGERVVCLWSKPTTAHVQQDHLSKVHELSRIFTLASKQLPPRPLDRTAYAAQCIVSTGLVAIFDALCRKKAEDTTLPVTTVLRGRSQIEAFQLSFGSFSNVDFKTLSERLLLETPELALARSKLCEYIESTVSHNVVLDLPPSPEGDQSFRMAKTDPTLQFYKKLLEAVAISAEYPPSILKAIQLWTDWLTGDDEDKRELGAAMMAEMGPGMWPEPQVLTGWVCDDAYIGCAKTRLSWGGATDLDTQSELYRKCPEALHLRNMVWNHKIVLQRNDVQIWNKVPMSAPRHGHSVAESFVYRLGYTPCPCATADFCDLQLGAFGIGPCFDDQPLKFPAELLEPSPSDVGDSCFTAGVETPRVKRKYYGADGREVNARRLGQISRLSSASTEDDIVKCPVLPSWEGLLSQTDAELLLSFLTVPMIRAPLIVSFFSSRVDMLFHPTMRNYLLRPTVFMPPHIIIREIVPCFLN